MFISVCWSDKLSQRKFGGLTLCRVPAWHFICSGIRSTLLYWVSFPTRRFWVCILQYSPPATDSCVVCGAFDSFRSKHELQVLLSFQTGFTGTVNFILQCVQWIYDSMTMMTGWWFGTWLLFFHILGIIIPTDFHIFQRGWNHQPDNCLQTSILYIMGWFVQLSRLFAHRPFKTHIWNTLMVLMFKANLELVIPLFLCFFFCELKSIVVADYIVITGFQTGQWSMYWKA